MTFYEEIYIYNNYNKPGKMTHGKKRNAIFTARGFQEGGCLYALLAFPGGDGLSLVHFPGIETLRKNHRQRRRVSSLYDLLLCVTCVHYNFRI
jgi:hypothetical protein